MASLLEDYMDLEKLSELRAKHLEQDRGKELERFQVRNGEGMY